MSTYARQLGLSRNGCGVQPRQPAFRGDRVCDGGFECACTAGPLGASPPYAHTRLAVARDQPQRDRVDAVALIRRRRITLAAEHVAQVAVAVRAQHLGTRRAHRMVGTQDHRVGARRVEKRRPPAVRLEFLRAAEQFSAARPAVVDALGLGVGVLAGEGSLGAGPAQDVEFLRIEPLAPLVVGQFKLADLRSCFHASSNGGDPLRPAPPRLRSPRRFPAWTAATPDRCRRPTGFRPWRPDSGSTAP